ncbi:MAG: phage holin family protein [Syntrophaceae bacterium]|jgi:putative membrane protein|nr:phage holin family protein [Syntrophaceae bacterium]HOC60206.1 phage holin family protein [Smithellaceae bacterium]HQM45795.1 phage holin family protein [Smithellaceae bacterium]
MLFLLTRWLVIAVAILLSSAILPGIRVDSLTTAILAAAVLGILNAFLRPVLLILTLPLTIVSLGIFAFVLNALMLLLVDYFVSGLEIDGFGWAFLGALIISMVSWIANRFINPSEADGKPSQPRRRKDCIDMERGDDGKWR